MTRILFVIDKLTYGGAQKMMTGIANNLEMRGFNITIYAYDSNSYHYPIDKDIEYIEGSSRHNSKYIKYFFKTLEIKKVIKNVDPDLVISFKTNPNVLSTIGTMLTRIPIIISERGDPSVIKGIPEKIKHYFYNFADRIVFQTEGARDFFSNRIKNKGIIIPNAVTMQRSKATPIEQRRKEISFVGRFDVKQKRQDLMVLAFKQVVKKHPEYKLVFYGDGDGQIEIERLVKEENLTDNIVFAGRIDDVRETIHNTGIFVLTSDYEGIPNALMEAMCLGIPAVATDCTPGGARLLIEDHVSGILCPRGDVSGIAEAINYLIENKAEAEKMGKNAQNIIEKFSPDKIYGLWEKAIIDTLDT